MFSKPVVKAMLFTMLAIAVAGGYFAYKEYNRRNPGMADVKAAFSLSADEVLKAFESNNAEATKKYMDQVLELNGSVKSIEKDSKGFYTVVLGQADARTTVRCSVDSLYSDQASSITSGTSTTLRGLCVGYMPDDLGVGADLLLGRCYPVK